MMDTEYVVGADTVLWADGARVARLLEITVRDLAAGEALPAPQRAAANACLYHLREAAAILELITCSLARKAQQNSQNGIAK